MSIPPPLSTVALAAALKASLSFSMDRVLACGPSAAWLDPERSASAFRHAMTPRTALITGFIDAG